MTSPDRAVAPLNLAVLVLCHEPADVLRDYWDSPVFRAPGTKLYVHYDGARSAAEFAALRATLPADVAIELLEDRIHCEWGEYSLVEATRRLLARATSDAAFAPDYVLLLSGTCVPIRPRASLDEFLRRRRGMDFIQAVDIGVRRWVRSGLEEERFRFWFPFSFVRHRRLFDWTVALQRKLGVFRIPPANLRVHFGSQWFCLTAATARVVVEALGDPAIAGFFRSTWIPDESVIQTLVANLRPSQFVAGHGLTYFEFDEMGRPLMVEDGHFEHLMHQPFFFARKLAPGSQRLQAQLRAKVAGSERDLSYFERAGTPTSDYQHFLARAPQVPSARAALGTTVDAWRGLMSHNARPYYVLYSSSPRYLQALLATVRRGARLPVFDDVFDPDELIPAREGGAWYGIQSSMRNRRDHDPASLLREIVHVDPDHPSAVAIDAGRDDWVRGYVVWDRHAIVIDCDPPQLAYERRAATALREMKTAQRYDAVAQLNAAVAGRKWLPGEFFQQARADAKHLCAIGTLDAPPPHAPDAIVPALQAAAARLDAAAFFAAPAEAERLLGAVPPPRAGA